LPTGQCVVLVVATDGVPTGNGYSVDARTDFMNALRSLMNDQSVHVVLRLCTNEDSVIDFYNEVESDLEMPLDVLDDLEGESREIYKQGNGWFTYTPEIHRFREGGTFLSLFDVMDERRLNPSEAALLAQLLLRDKDDAPLPFESDEFLDRVRPLADQAAPKFCIRRRRFVQPVHFRGLRYAILGAWAIFKPVKDFFRTLRRGCGVECGVHDVSYGDDSD